MGAHVTDWQTDREWFEALNALCHFTLDAAADHSNHLLSRYCAETGKYEGIGIPGLETGKYEGIGIPGLDGLNPEAWRGERVYCNPPYVNILPWVELGATGPHAGSVLVLPANLDTKWAHRHVLSSKHRLWHPVEMTIDGKDCWRGWRVEDDVVLFREGRLHFHHPATPEKDAPRYPNLLLGFGGIL